MKTFEHGILVDDKTIKISGPIPEKTKFLLIGSDSTIDCLDGRGRSITKILCETVDGDHPKYRLVIPSREAELVAWEAAR